MENMPTKTDLRASTKLACSIARVNSDRLNEAIHADFYPCAPRTTPGRARSFGVNDIVALRIYQNVMDSGSSASAAGKKACAISEFMHQYPDASRVFILETSFGPLDYLLPDFDVNQQSFMINDKQPIDVVGVEVINLDWHRARVVHYIEQADRQRVVGD